MISLAVGRLSRCGFRDVEEGHASDLVYGQHAGRQSGRGPEEMPTRQSILGGIHVRILADLLPHVAGKKQRCPLLLRGHRAIGSSLVVLEILEDIELHRVSSRG
jgi:hypothetical protein